MGIRSLAVRVGVVAVAAGASVSCSSAVTGQGSTGSGSAGSGSSADFPSQSPTPMLSQSSALPSDSIAASPSPSPSTPSPNATYHVVTVQGTSSGRSISVRVYASDTIADCAAHAYGSIVEFLRKHPCHGAHRVLATTVVGGRTAVLSAVSTSFSGTDTDPYGVTGKFINLERSDGTGSINDLLRDGHPIAGIANRIPQHEVFQVVGQDNGATIFDAWYAHGSTNDNDKTLNNLEVELFLTPLTNG